MDVKREASVYGQIVKREASVYGQMVKREASVYGQTVNREASVYGQTVADRRAKNSARAGATAPVEVRNERDFRV